MLFPVSLGTTMLKTTSSLSSYLSWRSWLSTKVTSDAYYARLHLSSWVTKSTHTALTRPSIGHSTNSKVRIARDSLKKFRKNNRNKNKRRKLPSLSHNHMRNLLKRRLSWDRRPQSMFQVIKTKHQPKWRKGSKSNKERSRSTARCQSQSSIKYNRTYSYVWPKKRLSKFRSIHLRKIFLRTQSRDKSHQDRKIVVSRHL